MNLERGMNGGGWFSSPHPLKCDTTIISVSQLHVARVCTTWTKFHIFFPHLQPLNFRNSGDAQLPPEHCRRRLESGPAEEQEQEEEEEECPLWTQQGLERRNGDVKKQQENGRLDDKKDERTDIDARMLLVSCKLLCFGGEWRVIC